MDTKERATKELLINKHDNIIEEIIFTSELLNQEIATDENLSTILLRFGTTTRSSITYIFENELNGGTNNITSRWQNWWVAPEFIFSKIKLLDSGVNSKFFVLDYENANLNSWKAKFINRESIYGNSYEFPEEEKKILQEFSIKSVAIVPIFLGHRWWGGIGFINLSDEFKWSDKQISSLKLLANLIGLGIERKQINIELLRLSKYILEQKQFLERLENQANRDHLTSLYNRRYFNEMVEHHMKIASRYGTFLALLIMDLDRFKEVNDTFGHSAGDMLLLSVSTVLKKTLRDSDILSRLGGDEFAILIPNANIKQAQDAANRILKNIQLHSVVFNNKPVTITASIGISIFPQNASTAEMLFSYADIALFQSKKKGRNCYSQCKPEISSKSEIENIDALSKHIYKGLDGKLFILYCQPILDLRSKGTYNYELLLRMEAQEGEKVFLPGDFLKVAERRGQIEEIDEWVIKNAVVLLSQYKELNFSINLSNKIFAESRFSSKIKHHILSSQVNPSHLIFEIPASSAVTETGKVKEFISPLKEIGCKFTIDNFGTGFLSFTQLKHITIDYIKIDGSFICNLPDSLENQYLLRAMIYIATSLNSKTVATHVENQKTLLLLEEFGLDFVQGYHIGQPIPLNDLLKTFEK